NRWSCSTPPPPPSRPRLQGTRGWLVRRRVRRSPIGSARMPGSELRTASAHAFVTDLEHPALAPDDRHHLERALRLRPEEVVTVSDGAGGWRPCRFGTELEPLAPTIREVRLDPRLTVAFAPVKGDRPELVVQKLTELGIDRIVP